MERAVHSAAAGISCVATVFFFKSNICAKVKTPVDSILKQYLVKLLWATHIFENPYFCFNPGSYFIDFIRCLMSDINGLK